MLDFTFHNPTKILFGKGMVSGIGAEIKKYSDRILLVYGKGSVKKTGIYDDVVDELKKSSIEWFELAGVDPNPRIESVNQGAKLCREHSLGLVLAVGGGSVITSYSIHYTKLYEIAISKLESRADSSDT